MSYTKHPLAMGGITDVALAAKSVVEDPCLFETADLLLKLNELQKKPTTPGTPSAPGAKGIGLCKATPYLRKAVWVYERPWVGVAVGLGVVGGLIGLGYILGSSGRRGAGQK